MTEYEQKSYLDLDSLLEQQKDSINQSNSQASQGNRKSIYMFIKGFIFGILITLGLLVTVYFFSKEKIINKLIDYDSKSDCMYTKIDDQGLDKQNESELLDVENNIKEGKKIDNNLEDGNLIDNGITFTATPKVSYLGKKIGFTTNNDSNKEIKNYSREFDEHILNNQFVSEADYTYSHRGIYDVKLTVQYEDDSYSTYQDEIFIGEFDSPIAAYTVKNNEGEKLTRLEGCRILNDKGYENVENAYSVQKNENFTIDPSISINTRGKMDGLMYLFEKETTLGGNKIELTDIFTSSFSDTGCHYVDFILKDANFGKQDKVRIWFNVE